MKAEGFAQIYDAHYPRVFRYLLARTRKLQEAEELAAEVFVVALEGLRRGAEPRHLGNWLVGIANHVASRFWREQAIKEPLSDASWAREEDPEELAIERLETQALWWCLDALSSEHRQVLLLRVIVGLSAREVGEVMGKTEEAIRSLQWRALKALRRRWMEENEHEGPRRSAYS
jgi:RNA polymerase sigma-70 factor (ECF subfamily)